jgi:hypothetical protein
MTPSEPVRIGSADRLAKRPVLIVIYRHLAVIQEAAAKAASSRGLVERPIVEQPQGGRSWLDMRFPG